LTVALRLNLAVSVSCSWSGATAWIWLPRNQPGLRCQAVRQADYDGRWVDRRSRIPPIK
jgi:hypothetical protein